MSAFRHDSRLRDRPAPPADEGRTTDEVAALRAEVAALARQVRELEAGQRAGRRHLGGLSARVTFLEGAPGVRRWVREIGRGVTRRQFLLEPRAGKTVA